MSKGWKIYLTPEDRQDGRWVVFDRYGTLDKQGAFALGLALQPSTGFKSEDEAWAFAEKLLRKNPEVENAPASYFTLKPYKRNSRRQPEFDFTGSRELSSFLDVDGSELFDKDRDVKRYEQVSRPKQDAFRVSVFARYGSACAVCGISCLRLLEAAHIIAWCEKGADVPENGLVLCHLHHRALDAGFIRIDPVTLSLLCCENGPSLSEIHVKRQNICHLPKRPSAQALRWLWQRGDTNDLKVLS